MLPLLSLPGARVVGLTRGLLRDLHQPLSIFARNHISPIAFPSLEVRRSDRQVDLNLGDRLLGRAPWRTRW